MRILSLSRRLAQALAIGFVFTLHAGAAPLTTLGIDGVALGSGGYTYGVADSYAPFVFFDADAQAFIDAAGITSPVQQASLHRLVVELKQAGAWQRLHAIYPMIGGTSLAHSRNLKNPADSDTAYRLTFYGSPVHSATGVAWNGSTQYADTHYVPSAHLDATTGATISYYAAGAAALGDVYEMGAYLNASCGLLLSTRNGSLNPPCPFVAAYVTQEGAGNNDPEGDYLVSRPPGVTTAARIYRHGLDQNPAGMVTTDSSVPPTVSVWLGALNVNGGGYGHTTRSCRFAFIGEWLNEAQIFGTHAAIQRFQVTNNRAI